VIDGTTFTQAFDFSLEWAPDPRLAGPEGVTSGARRPSIFAAVQEQLGLKLEARKAPIDALVIDRVERPSGN